MERLIESLKQLNISEEEIIVYGTILELNTTTVLQISQKTNIPRTTVYLLVDALIKKSFVQEIEEGKKKKYKANSPDEIMVYAKKQKDQIVKTIDILDKDLPQLKAIYGSSHEQPKLRYIQGLKELQKLLKESYNSQEIFLWFISNEGRELLGDEFEIYKNELVKKQIHSVEFVLNDVGGNDYKKRFDTARNQIITVDQKNKTESDYMLFGDTFVFITYRNSLPQCTIIVDAELAYFEKVRLQAFIDRRDSNI